MKINNMYIGIDIGGTNTEIGLIDSTGKLLIENTIPTLSSESFNDFLKVLDLEIIEFIKQSPLHISGIGIGIPGANVTTGFVEAPENFNWGKINICKILELKYNLPIKILNDADAAAIGELHFGVAKDLKNFVHVTLGTGVGNSTIVNGTIITGHLGIAGEIGHSKVYPSNRMCSCGKRGCLETYVSANGIKRTVFELLCNEKTDSKLKEYSYSQLTSKIITDFAKTNDPIAVEAYLHTGKVLGEKLATVIGLINPEAIVFSGGLISAGKFLFDPMTKSIDENLLNMHKNTVEIRFSDSSKNYAILGAVSLFLRNNSRKNKTEYVLNY